MIAKNKLLRPMSREQVRKMKPSPAKGKPPADLTTRVFSTYLGFEKGTKPETSTRLEHVRDVQGRGVWRLDVETKGSVMPPEFARPSIERRALSRNVLTGIRGPLEVAPHRPEFIGLNPLPKKSAAFRRAVLRRRDGRQVDPLYVFPPDGRYAYHDHNYPWCCFGRVECADGRTGSGVLVGPRHVLTASHILDWNAPWAVFRANLRGSHQHAVANTWCVWYYEKITGGGDTVDRDYVVCVLDQPLGQAQTFGCMGSKTYSDDWDDEPYWSSLGYEEDMGTATLPTYQAGISMEEIDGGNMKAMSTRDGDFAHCHSGGPVFAWWDGLPYVVGVVSAGAEDEDGLMNIVSGGVAMVRLIKAAREQTP
jgi:V8-like Glu-specific endopeptidase